MNKLVLLIITILITCLNGQQICIKQSCAAQIAACDLTCVKLMGKCTFDCTLMSQGCMQDCVTTNNPAKALLECSYNKCLNY
jgi:hypothetical protein